MGANAMTAKFQTTAETLLLLNEAISLGRRDGMAGQHLDAMCSARDEIERLSAIMERARPLVALVTVRMAIHGGDETIAASGLNPWCMNEGLATGDEGISTWWMQ